MSAHTPGPWSPDFSHRLSCGCEAWRAGLDSGIAYCPLHAAAPELLEALANLTHEMLWITDQTDDGRLEAIERLHKDGAVIEAARAAIAKAKGGTS